MSLADLKKKRDADEKPKGLAALKSKPKNKSTGLATLKGKSNKKPTGLAGLKKKKEQSMKLIAKQDFVREGVRFSNCQFCGPGTMDPICYGGAPGAFWSVDVTNGDKTITCHNRWGAWLSGGLDRDGELLPGYNKRRPGGSDLLAWVAAGCRDRYMEELKARKLPDINKLRVINEEQAKQERKRLEDSERIAVAKSARKAKKDREKTIKPKSKGRGLAALKGK